MNPVSIGICGGMGPYATLAFFKEILDRREAKKDWDHLHLVIDCNPHIPSRTRHHLFAEASPVPGMIESCRKLAAYPVAAIALPCNSAQAWLAEVQAEVSVPILNIMESTVQEACKEYSGMSGICVLGGRVTWARQTYRLYAERVGLIYNHIDEEQQSAVEKIIEQIKIQENLSSAVKKMKSILIDIQNTFNDTVIILGCTEFGCIKNDIKNFYTIDSSETYAKYVISYADNIL